MSTAVQRVSDAIAEARNQWRPGPAPGLENADGKSLFAAEAEAAIAVLQIDREQAIAALDKLVRTSRRFGYVDSEFDRGMEELSELQKADRAETEAYHELMVMMTGAGL